MKKLALTTVLISMAAFNASAEINISGFGSVVGGAGMGDDAIVDSPGGVDGYGDDFEFKTGSFFALQAQSDLGEGLGATVQIMSRGSEDWNPEFTWAYISYDINDSWRVLAGRQRMPHYMFSDYLDVSYAYHWITPPSEVYGSPFDSIDGFSVINTINFDNSSLTTQVAMGQDKPSDEDSFSFTNVMGVRTTYNYDWFTLRLAHFTFDFTFTIPDVGDTTGNLTSQDVTLQIDRDNLLVIAEYSPVDLTKVGFGEIKPWMLSVGYRFGNIMPHVTVGKYKNTAAFFGGLDYPYTTVGARWDFHSSAALKVEYSTEEDAAGNEASSLQFALTTVF